MHFQIKLGIVIFWIVIYNKLYKQPNKRKSTN